jgi:hypothetical protein
MKQTIIILFLFTDGKFKKEKLYFFFFFFGFLNEFLFSSIFKPLIIYKHCSHS